MLVGFSVTAHQPWALDCNVFRYVSCRKSNTFTSLNFLLQYENFEALQFGISVAGCATLRTAASEIQVFGSNIHHEIIMSRVLQALFGTYISNARNSKTGSAS
ncbi:hypothetical protein AKJ16_DCAP18136 [Drosera capensis]